MTGSTTGEGLRPAADAAALVRRFLALDTRSAAALGAAIVLLVGVPLAAVMSIWIDEAFTLHTTAAGVGTAWTRTIAFEDQPPLYFVLEAVWRTFDRSSIAIARLPSVFFAAAAVALVVYAARRVAPGVPPVIVALIAALNPFVIWAAVELRVYALVIAVGAGLVWAFYEGFLVERPSRRAQIWYVVFAIAGLYTQFYVGFLLAAQGITLLAMRRGTFAAFAVATAVIAVAFAPFVPVALVDTKASSEFVLHPTLLHAVREVLDALFVMVLPHDGNWAGPGRLLGLVSAGALFAGLIGLGRPGLPHGPVRAVLVQWALSVVIFSLVFTVAGVPLVPLKYLAVIAPSTLLAALVFAGSLRRRSGVAATTFFAVYAAFALTALWGQYRPPFLKPGDWPRVASTVASDAATTPVVVFPAELAQPLKWYLAEPTIELPRPMRFTLGYVRDMSLSGEADVARTLDAIHPAAGPFWLITTGDCRASIPGYYDYHCGYLESYLRGRYRTVKSVAFNGALARLYVRIANETADLNAEAK